MRNNLLNEKKETIVRDGEINIAINYLLIYNFDFFSQELIR